MSFGNKDNGREYINRSNSNANKMQSMGNRNINLSQQYSNSNNGENYTYDMKAQRGCNSPKQSGEIHTNNQQNVNVRDHYQYNKNENSRNRSYQPKYSSDRSNYYTHQSQSPVNVVIPDIDQLKEFIREQSEQFKNELARYEDRKSSSPSPRTNYHQDQGLQRSQQRPPVGQNRIISGMSTSNSLGTITTSNSNFSGGPTFASTAMSNLEKQTNSYSNKCNYNKTVQSSGKSSQFTRNISHEDNFSKAPPINKNRVGSPNNTHEKSPGNKSQFTTSNGGAIRQDNKSDTNKPNKCQSYAHTTGNNFVPSQQNSNNPFNAHSHANKTNQQLRQNSNSGSNSYKNSNSNASYDTQKNSAKLNGDMESMKTPRAEVRVSLDNARHISNSGNTTDSQDVEYGTPDSPTSPSSFRSSQIEDNRGGNGYQRLVKKVHQ